MRFWRYRKMLYVPIKNRFDIFNFNDFVIFALNQNNFGDIVIKKVNDSNNNINANKCFILVIRMQLKVTVILINDPNHHLYFVSNLKIFLTFQQN